MKGPNNQTPPLKLFSTKMGNWEIIMHKSEKAKLYTNILAGVLSSFVFEKR